MGRRREPEGPRHELPVDRPAGFLDLGEQLIEETLVLFTCLERRHRLSVLRASEAYLRGRNPRLSVEVTLSMTRNRRRNARKVAKLARVLATLDEHARTVRPAPKRAAKVSFSR
jgi:hypothetical protein